MRSSQLVRLAGEAGGVDALAGGEEAARLLDAVGQEEDRAAVVAAAGVVEADADLEDALVEAADRAALGVPLVLDRLVRLVELAGVEEADALQDAGRRRSRRRDPPVRRDRRQQRIEGGADAVERRPVR